jgi:hypothetical protein
MLAAIPLKGWFKQIKRTDRRWAVDALVTKDLARVGRHNAKVLLFLDYLDHKK